MNEIYLFKSKMRRTRAGKPIWIRCKTEAAALGMGPSYEVRKVVFPGMVPTPRPKETYSIYDEESLPIADKKKRDPSDGATSSGTKEGETDTNSKDSHGSVHRGVSGFFWDGVDA